MMQINLCLWSYVRKQEGPSASGTSAWILELFNHDEGLV